MADFNQAIPKILKSEGGYSDNRNDLGNYVCRGGKWAKRKKGGGFYCDNDIPPHFIGTNRGIAAPTLSGWRKREVSISDMRNLSEAEAIKIYKSTYWNPIGADNITDQKKANVLFDAYVNQGNLIRPMLAEVLGVSESSIKYPLRDDIIGKINGDNNFVRKFVEQRETKYKQIATKPGQAGFLAGWMNRLDEFRETVTGGISKTWKIVIGVVVIAGLGALVYGGAKK